MNHGAYLLICALVCTESLEWHFADARKLSRAITHLDIEILVIADYSTFAKWYKLTPATGTNETHINATKHKIKEYVGALFHTSNKIYESLQSRGLYITLSLVDVYIVTDAAGSPWIETVKVNSSHGFEIDPDRVYPLFLPRSVEWQKTAPHDHAMTLTEYDVYHAGKNKTFAGNAYVSAECQPKSLSIVENTGFDTAITIAHEVGHSIGCEHDGDKNNCNLWGNYTMEAVTSPGNTKKYIFSNCSFDYIKTFLNQLNQQHHNCLVTTENTHIDPEFPQEEKNWFGKLYVPEEQCKIQYGPTSYVCRDHYHDVDFTHFCTRLICYDPVKKGCYVGDFGDGTPCDVGKWCMSGVCTNDSKATIVSASCLLGEKRDIVYKGKTCAEIVRTSPNDCNIVNVKHACCESCPKVHTSAAISVDDQCMRSHGPRSSMCRTSSAYTGHMYADVVCKNLQCHDPQNPKLCIQTDIDDKTACGHLKWCIDGKCVHDNLAPAVPDNCPFGDEKGAVTLNGLTCDNITQPGNAFQCTSNSTAIKCCHTCGALHRSIPGCEYGDKTDCHTILNYACYNTHNADVCCETCAKFKNAFHIGCEYGDKVSGCVKQSCSRYTTSSRANCCETCRNDEIPVG